MEKYNGKVGRTEKYLSSDGILLLISEEEDGKQGTLLNNSTSGM